MHQVLNSLIERIIWEKGMMHLRENYSWQLRQMIIP